MDELFLVDETMELSDIMIECASLANEYETFITASDAIFENDNLKDEVVKLNFESSSNEMWENIKEKLQTFLAKVGQFFRMLWIKVKETFVENEYKSIFLPSSFDIKRGLELATDKDTIEVKNWKKDNPVLSFLGDIYSIPKVLKAIYDAGDDLVYGVMNGKFDNESVELNSKIHGMYEVLTSNFKLPKSPEDKLPTVTEIRENILSLYLDKSENKKLKTVAAKDFVDNNFDIIDNIHSMNGYSSVKGICDIISTRSSKLSVSLKQADRLVHKLSFSQDEEDIEKVKFLKSNTIKVLNNVQSLCRIIGQTYWELYLSIRTDVKKACKVFVKLAESEKHK